MLEEALDSTLLREEAAELWTELRSSRSLRSRRCATVSLAGSDHDTLNMLEKVGPSMRMQQVETREEEIQDLMLEACNPARKRKRDTWGGNNDRDQKDERGGNTITLIIAKSGAKSDATPRGIDVSEARGERKR